jgi:hypothetical protein
VLLNLLFLVHILILHPQPTRISCPDDSVYVWESTGQDAKKFKWNLKGLKCGVSRMRKLNLGILKAALNKSLI